MPIFTIEVANRNNRSLFFAPLQRKVRGRWTAAYTAHKDKSPWMKEMSRIEIILGQCISLDTDKREGQVFDPLRETEDGRRIFEEINVVNENHQFESGGRKRVDPPAIVRDLTVDQMKTWLFCMAQAVETGIARETDSSHPLPRQSDVRRMPGKRLRDPVNSLRRGDESEAELYADIVPVDGEGELVGAGIGSQSTGRRGRPPKSTSDASDE